MGGLGGHIGPEDREWLENGGYEKLFGSKKQKIKPCSKSALSELNKKEKQLKELLLDVIMATQAKKGEVIRTLSWIINAYKSKRVR